MVALVQSRLILPLVMQKRSDKRGVQHDTKISRDDMSDDSECHSVDSADEIDMNAITQLQPLNVEFHEWDQVAYTLNHLIMIPRRFTRDLSRRLKFNRIMSGPNSDEYAFGLFRLNVSIRDTIVDITPWLVIALITCWRPVTVRYLQLLNCESFFTGGKNSDKPPEMRLMMATSVICNESGLHGLLVAISYCGLLLWSIGIIASFTLLMQRYDRQGMFVRRNFSYFLEGYELRSWWWETTVKKVDLFIVALITYSNIASDAATKLVSIALWTIFIMMVHSTHRPYDNREVNLLDRIESFALNVRVLVFVGISLCLVFKASRWFMTAVAAAIIFSTVAFTLKVLIHAVDGKLVLETTKIDRLIAISWKELRRSLQRKCADTLSEIQIATDLNASDRAKLEYQGWKKSYDLATTKCQRLLAGLQVEAPSTNKGKLLTLAHDILFILRKVTFPAYRVRQMLRLKWLGPTTDSVIYIPELREGHSLTVVEETTLPFYVQVQCKLQRAVFNLSAGAQLDFLIDGFNGFFYLLLFGAKFQQIPGRSVDIVMLLTVGVKRRKHRAIYDPMLPNENSHTTNSATVAKKGRAEPELKEQENEECSDEAKKLNPQQSQRLRDLKAVILSEVFTRLRDENQDRSHVMEELKSKLASELADRGIPQDFAWDVLETMTTRQLRCLRPNPKQIILRLKFYQLLLRCECDPEKTKERVLEDRRAEDKERHSLMVVMSHDLRSRLEKEPTLVWDDVVEQMARLPVEEVARLESSPNECIDFVRELTRIDKDERQDHRSALGDMVTVEDVNDMLMYIETLRYEELEELLEYAQWLVDFLQIPVTDVWRGLSANAEQEVVEPKDETPVAFAEQLARHAKELLRADGLAPTEGNTSTTVDVVNEGSSCHNPSLEHSEHSALPGGLGASSSKGDSRPFRGGQRGFEVSYALNESSVEFQRRKNKAEKMLGEHRGTATAYGVAADAKNIVREKARAHDCSKRGDLRPRRSGGLSPNAHNIELILHDDVGDVDSDVLDDSPPLSIPSLHGSSSDEVKMYEDSEDYISDIDSESFVSAARGDLGLKVNDDRFVPSRQVNSPRDHRMGPSTAVQPTRQPTSPRLGERPFASGYPELSAVLRDPRTRGERSRDGIATPVVGGTADATAPVSSSIPRLRREAIDALRERLGE
eukprot:TRINITY_DN48511_c0_g1_i1.p1 TRINITY_DN48511_c0_g1~~TRINITY_DN48511_c0_g1_i1.p1  ORF type:complete len:1190 (+),score=161.02 TRINITY_DN48511_c0_g1_i1:73-3570(+)